MKYFSLLALILQRDPQQARLGQHDHDISTSAASCMLFIQHQSIQTYSLKY